MGFSDTWERRETVSMIIAKKDKLQNSGFKVITILNVQNLSTKHSNFL